MPWFGQQKRGTVVHLERGSSWTGVRNGGELQLFLQDVYVTGPYHMGSSVVIIISTSGVQDHPLAVDWRSLMEGYAKMFVWTRAEFHLFP